MFQASIMQPLLCLYHYRCIYRNVYLPSYFSNALKLPRYVIFPPIMNMINFNWTFLTDLYAILPSLGEFTYCCIGDYQRGFWRNRSTIDHIFCIHQILEKKWEYNEEVHQLFIHFKKAYDSVRREVLYKILIEFGIPRKLVRLIKMRKSPHIIAR